MRLFNNFKDYIFTHLFNSYYKRYDTYKRPDMGNKGILERFIDTCGQYLDDNIVGNIGGAVDLIDVDTVPDLYLNYIWEMFGRIPYAYGVVVSGNTYSEENYKIWLENTKKIFPKAEARKALRYAIKLFQVRGTQRFFELLARFYGLTISITNDEEEGTVDSDGISNQLIVATYGDPISEGIEYIDQLGNIQPWNTKEDPFIKSTYYGDISSTTAGFKTDGSACRGCTKVHFIVRMPWHKYTGLTNDQIEHAREVYKKIFTKYIPVDFEILDFKLLPQYPPIIIPKPLWVEGPDGSISPNFPVYESDPSNMSLEVYKV